jgi:predicted Zn-dependent peptidase
VVKEERRLRSENNILGAMDEVLDAAAYLAHPYHWPVIGWMGDINNITVDDCHDYFRTYYAPNNATVIVVGDFKTKELLELIEKYYREIPGQTPPRNPVNSEPRQRGQRRVLFYKKAEVETFGVAFQAPAADAPGFYAAEVLQYILGSGRSSRLYKRLIYDAQIAANVNVFTEWRRHPGLLKIYVDMKPGHKASEGEKMLDEELTRIREQPVSETELQKAKNNIRAHFIRQMKTNQGKGEVVGTFEILWGDWAKHKEFLDKIDAVTVENVKEAAAHYLSDLNETVVTLVPQEPPGDEESSGTAPAQESGGEGGGAGGAASHSVGDGAGSEDGAVGEGGAVGEDSADSGSRSAGTATGESGRSDARGRVRGGGDAGGGVGPMSAARGGRE